MIRLVTYADHKMTVSEKLCWQSAEKNGVEKNKSYPFIKEDIGKEFTIDNFSILSHERGCGYWLWKPYFINRAMRLCNDNDILIYADAGVEFVAPVSHIIDRMDEDVFLFTNTHPNHHWTKRYTLDKMMPGWERRYDKDTPWPQVQASVIFIKVNEYTRNFIKTWLLWCQMPGIINDWKGALPEYPFFQDHRHDQSVLSILATMENFKLHWWPTQYSFHLERPEPDNYPVMFNHHRKRDPGKGDGQPEWE